MSVRKPISSGTGNAQIKRQGHTAVSGYGANPNAQPKGKAAEKPRDLKVGRSGR